MNVEQGNEHAEFSKEIGQSAFNDRERGLNMGVQSSIKEEFQKSKGLNGG
jgi:hypothetical protein